MALAVELLEKRSQAAVVARVPRVAVTVALITHAVVAEKVRVLRGRVHEVDGPVHLELGQLLAPKDLKGRHGHLQ